MTEEDTSTSKGSRFDLQLEVHSDCSPSPHLPDIFPQPTEIQSGGLEIVNFPQERMAQCECVFICQSVLTLQYTGNVYAFCRVCAGASTILSFY